MPNKEDKAEALNLAQVKVAMRQRCKTDKLFLAEQLGFDFQWETHAELFANYIQYNENKPWGEQSTVKDVMVLWSRGHYKTTSLVVEIIQAIINFPDIRILIMQGSLPLTKTFLKQVVAHFTGEALDSKFKDLFPEHCGNYKQLKSTSMAFTTKARKRLQLAQATVSVASVRSGKTGQHYDMGFFDDLVNDQNFRSEKLREKISEDFFLAQALIDPGGYRFVTGTRYSFGDLYETIQKLQLQSGKWIISVTTCWTDATDKLPDDQKVPRFPQFTKRNGEIGGFTREQLLQMQTDDPANFSCQYLNKPIATANQVFTEEILYKACLPASSTPKLSDCILMIDVAITGAAHDDDSVIQVGRTDSNGVIYVCDQRGDKWKPPELADQIIALALLYRPSKIVLEKSAAGQVFADYLKLAARIKNVYLPLDFIAVDNKDDAKNIRVAALAGAVKRGRFKFLMGLPKFSVLIEQAITFPKGRYGHDDYIDTSALLFMELAKNTIQLPIRHVVDPLVAMLTSQNSLENQLTTDYQPNDYTEITGLD